MPPFVGRSAGLLTQPSTLQLKFRSPVPSNPMLIPAFIQREVAPLGHTHSQGDVTGAGAKASAATRGLFISLNPEVNNSLKAYFEVRDGLSARASEQWMLEAYIDTVDPALRPRGTISTASVITGELYILPVLAASAQDIFFHTTPAGSAIIRYADDSNLTVFLAANLVGPTTLGSAITFT